MMRMPNQGGQNPMQRMTQMMQMMALLPKFMKDPVCAMMSCGLNIPDNIQGNPQAMTNFLLNSGQMTQEQYDTVAPLANMAQSFFGRKS